MKTNPSSSIEEAAIISEEVNGTWSGETLPQLKNGVVNAEIIKNEPLTDTPNGGSSNTINEDEDRFIDTLCDQMFNDIFDDLL